MNNLRTLIAACCILHGISHPQTDTINSDELPQPDPPVATITARPYEDSDLRACLHLASPHWQDLSQTNEYCPELIHQLTYRERQFHTHAQAIVAEKKGAIQSFALFKKPLPLQYPKSLRTESSNDNLANLIAIVNSGNAPAESAATVLEASLESLNAQGAAGVYVIIPTNNTADISLYQHHGFIIIDDEHTLSTAEEYMRSSATAINSTYLRLLFDTSKKQDEGTHPLPDAISTKLSACITNSKELQEAMRGILASLTDCFDHALKQHPKLYTHFNALTMHAIFAFHITQSLQTQTMRDMYDPITESIQLAQLLATNPTEGLDTHLTQLVSICAQLEANMYERRDANTIEMLTRIAKDNGLHILGTIAAVWITKQVIWSFWDAYHPARRAVE